MRSTVRPFTLVLALAVVSAGGYLAAQAPSAPDASRVQARYTKSEYQIPMRDGVKLFTIVYTPKDTAKTYPFMMVRTPYSVAPYGPDMYRPTLGQSELFEREGFIFVYQDVRGRFMSEGDWVEMRPHRATKNGPKEIDESTDTYDTIAWLLKNVPNNNGNVGIWGISYPGFYAAASLPDAHPALKAVSPQAPIADLFMGDDAFHNGAFMLAANYGFYTGFWPRGPKPSPSDDSPEFEFGTPDGYDYYLRLGPLANTTSTPLGKNPYWQPYLQHTSYDQFWRERSIVPHLKGVKPAVLSVGGWFDAEDLAGPLAVYRSIESNSPGTTSLLVMGPWAHGGWSRSSGERLGNLDFGGAQSVFYREKIEFPFFMHHLKGAAADGLPEAYIFETGRNEWRRYDVWPPRDARTATYYFADGQRLSTSAPTGTASTTGAAGTSGPVGGAGGAGAAGVDEYVSDPAKPVPYLGYVAMGMTRDYMTEDQRFAATRPDVLVYETEPLTEDLTVAGPIEVKLHVSTTGTDADWVVKVIDVYPGDYRAPRPAEASPNQGSGPSPGSGSPQAQGQAAGTGVAMAPVGPPVPPPANWVRMGGYQQLVRGEPFRGKFRNGFDKPQAFVPNEPALVSFALPDVLHTFRKGHRMMVQVQSSWFPLIDRNPQTFVEIPSAKPSDFRKSTHRVYRSRDLPSSVTFKVVSGAAAR